MIVLMKTNLGSTDAKAIGLEYMKCCAGMKAEVSDSAGEWLLAKGYAEAVESKNILRGVSSAAPIGEASQPTIKAEPATAKAKQASHKD